MKFIQPKTQELQSLNIKNYSVRIIVAGTRKYNNRIEFHNLLCEYISNFNTPILFISGAAATGADRLIIQWCKKFKYPCLEKPANWEMYPGVAGFIRNKEMSQIATHLLAFYDGQSNGTKDMINNANLSKIITQIILIKGIKKNV